MLSQNQEEAQETHDCIVSRRGNWAVFSCPKCPDYERRINLLTGDMKTRKSLNPINHRGTLTPVGMQPERYSPN
jgi:hypothetical protein